MFSVLIRPFVRMFSEKRVMKRTEVWHGISHGFHVVGSEGLVLARREEVEGLEIWLFGAFDKNMQAPVSNYLQKNLFSRKLDKVHMERKVATTMKNIYLLTRETTHNNGESAYGTGGFTTALIMNAEKFVTAEYGGYKTVVCRDGVAVEIGEMHRRENKGGCSLSDLVPKKFIARDGKKSRKSSKVTVTATHEVESGIEFIVLASDGVWKVMNNQEAVDLVSHIDNAQTAAEVLAKKAAIVSTSKSIISCIVIRFH